MKNGFLFLPSFPLTSINSLDKLVLLLMTQTGALVHIYLDGSILLTHGGTECGQGLHTKMIQVHIGLELITDLYSVLYIVRSSLLVFTSCLMLWSTVIDCHSLHVCLFHSNFVSKAPTVWHSISMSLYRWHWRSLAGCMAVIGLLKYGLRWWSN